MNESRCQIDTVHHETGYCLDCGAEGDVYRQPWRGVLLCHNCWKIDTQDDDPETD